MCATYTPFQSTRRCWLKLIRRGMRNCGGCSCRFAPFMWTNRRVDDLHSTSCSRSFVIGGGGDDGSVLGQSIVVLLCKQTAANNHQPAVESRGEEVGISRENTKESGSSRGKSKAPPARKSAISWSRLRRPRRDIRHWFLLNFHHPFIVFRYKLGWVTNILVPRHLSDYVSLLPDKRVDNVYAVIDWLICRKEHASHRHRLLMKGTLSRLMSHFP